MAEIHAFPKQEITFDEFWSIYPKRVAKLAAKKAWAKALREDTADNILAGLRRYLECLPEDPQFIPHCATWLNAGRWLDEQPPRKKYAWETEADYQRYLRGRK